MIFFKEIEKYIIRIISILFKFLNSNVNARPIFLIKKTTQINKILNILDRMYFYIPDLRDKGKFQINITLRDFISNKPIFIFDSLKKPIWYKFRFILNYYVDYDSNPTSEWEWHRYLEIKNREIDIIGKYHSRLISFINLIKKNNYYKCYIFGTGSSLEKAKNHNWNDGYRIVCNTIVKDKNLWNHINPHFIVAADAIYHFGHNTFAKKFRSDLKKRLSETKTVFLYPNIFDYFISKNFKEYSDRLIPIPIGTANNIYYGLHKQFVLPSLGNVLLLMLLPLACTLSKNIFLWGFDGRAPNDNLFWKNSDKHFYQDDVEELKQEHPAFFNHFIPFNNPYKYIKTFHGDILEKCLYNAELNGWQFIMLHPSYTDALNKRFKRQD